MAGLIVAAVAACSFTELTARSSWSGVACGTRSQLADRTRTVEVGSSMLKSLVPSGQGPRPLMFSLGPESETVRTAKRRHALLLREHRWHRCEDGRERRAGGERDHTRACRPLVAACPPTMAPTSRCRAPASSAVTRFLEAGCAPACHTWPSLLRGSRPARPVWPLGKRPVARLVTARANVHCEAPPQP